MRRLTPLTLTVLALACGTTEPTTDSVFATIEHPSYTTPSTIGALITNHSSEKLFSNHCLLFQRLVDGAWTDATSAGPCPALRAEIRAGTISSAAGWLGPAAPAGQYRGMTRVTSDAGDDLTLVTGPFALQ